MKYIRKTKDVFMLYVDYWQGYEEEIEEETYIEIKTRLKEYSENCSFPVIYKKKRIKI